MRRHKSMLSFQDWSTRLEPLTCGFCSLLFHVGTFTPWLLLFAKYNASSTPTQISYPSADDLRLNVDAMSDREIYVGVWTNWSEFPLSDLPTLITNRMWRCWKGTWADPHRATLIRRGARRRSRPHREMGRKSLLGHHMLYTSSHAHRPGRS